MSTSEKNGSKKNQCIHLATVAASLAFGNISDVSCNNEGYISAKARFFSAEHCAYPVDCEITKEFAGPASGN